MREDLHVRWALTRPPVRAVQGVGRVGVVVSRQEVDLARKGPQRFERPLQRHSNQLVVLEHVACDDDEVCFVLLRAASAIRRTVS